MTDRYIRISGDMRVPPLMDADDVADAVTEMAEAHGWGFTGVTREITQGELDGEKPSSLTLEMVERARAEAGQEIAADGRFTEIESSVAGHALRIMEKHLRQQMQGGEQE